MLLYGSLCERERDVATGAVAKGWGYIDEGARLTAPHVAARWRGSWPLSEV
jgi:hypothetical protein